MASEHKHNFYVNDDGDVQCVGCNIYCVYATEMLDTLDIPCATSREKAEKGEPE